MRKTLLTDMIAAFFILLFVYAAVSKLADHTTFYQQLTQSPLLVHLAGLTSWLVPVIEIIIAVMLYTSRFRLAGLFGAFSLMLLFTWYVIIIVSFSEYIPCSCGGILSAMSWNQHLIFNSCCVVVAAAAILLHQPTGIGQPEQVPLVNLRAT